MPYRDHFYTSAAEVELRISEFNARVCETASREVIEIGHVPKGAKIFKHVKRLTWFDMAWFVIEYAKKHGHDATMYILEAYVLSGDAPRLSNVHPSKYDELCEELVRSY